MSNSKEKELKLKCLEIASQNSRANPHLALQVAKEYWSFVTEESTGSVYKSIPYESREIGKVYTDTDGINRRWNGVGHCPAIE
jgi:hypothetical protein